MEKQYINDEIVLIDEKIGSIITKDNGAFKYSDVIKPFLSKYKVGDKVNLTIYGDPKKVMYIKKGGEYKTNSPKPEPIKREVDKKSQGYVYLNGKWYATLGVLLNKIHELYPGRHRIKTEIIEFDWSEKRAICKATVEIFDNSGTVLGCFTGLGDSDKDSTTKNIQSAFLRMAETRSIVRALRWATNIAETSIDELPDRKEEEE